MFEQAKLKLQWAEHMIDQLGKACANFASEQRCEVRTEYDPKTKELRIYSAGEFAPVWPSIVMLAGTSAHTINSSLDYVTSEIINTAKHTDRRVVFPIDVDRKQLEASQAIKTLAKFSGNLAAHILDEIQPTKLDNFPIWAIRNLANTDKHRNLVVAVHNQGFEIGPIKKTGVEMPKVRVTVPAGTQDDGYFSFEDVHEYGNAEAIIQIAFREPDLIHPNLLYRMEVVEFLRGGLQAAAEAVNSIEQFLTPK